MFKIGSINVDVPLVLAPMEDVTNLAFRLIAKRIGNPGLMFTEFVSAMAIHYNPARTLHKMRVVDEERPLGIQIFGAEPDKMADAARKAEEMGADLVDINMGCWVPKVCRTGSGAALLKDPETAERVVKAVVNAVKVPVTVKVRAGWDASHFAAPEFAKRFQDCGVQMMTLHARFARQGFDGEADWDLLTQMRKAITIPLIGNGDVKNGADALNMLKETGCDGVMIGRAAISNPWVLNDIRQSLLTGIAQQTAPTAHQRADTMIQHARLMVTHTAEDLQMDEHSPETQLKAIRALRGQLPLYLKAVQGSSQFRAKLSQVSSLAEIEDIAQEWLKGSVSSLC